MLFGRPSGLSVTDEIGVATAVELADLLVREALVVPDEPGEDVGRLLDGAVVAQRDLNLRQPDAPRAMPLSSRTITGGSPSKTMRAWTGGGVPSVSHACR